MILKSYLQTALADVQRYVALFDSGRRTPAEAFARFWATHPRSPLALAEAGPKAAVRPYQTTAALAAVPQLTVKVPTGGGKTYLACHAVGALLGPAPVGTPKLAVWLVPSLAILDQTLRALRNPRHPYRQALEAASGGQVVVIDKQELARGRGLLAAGRGEQLTVAVLVLDTLRTTDPDNRKAYEANSSNLAFVAAFAHELPTPVLRPDGTPTDPTATMNVLRALAPLVIIDESHHAKTKLSDQLLAALAPRFVLELTATPRPASNLLALVSAQALKQEHMVKLPVLVQNRHRKSEVLVSAKLWQERLETLARAHQKKGGYYVRPIVLLQAESRTGAADRADFDKVKADLLKLGVPEAHIKIKVAGRDELLGLDLLSPQCVVRYIITVNALAEGWDCAFAYVLASLANRSSPVQVEQLLGRVLRQPYATPHPEKLLNCSYVFTASDDFDQALKNILAGLEVAGFTAADCRRLPEPAEAEAPAPARPGEQARLFAPPAANAAANADDDDDTPEALAALGAAAAALAVAVQSSGSPSPQERGPGGEGTAAALLASLETLATEATAAATAAEAGTAAVAANPTLAQNPLAAQTNQYVMRPDLAAAAQALHLPNFMVPVPGPGLLFTAPVPLNKGYLLADFDLSKQNTDIPFDQQADALKMIDLTEQADHSYTPIVGKVDAQLREPLLAYFRTSSPERQRQDVATHLIKFFGTRLNYLSAAAVRAYVGTVLAPFDPEQLRAAYTDPGRYATAILLHLDTLTDEAAMRAFDRKNDTNALDLVPDYRFPARQQAKTAAVPRTRSLYEREEDGNGPEKEMMEILASADNLVFWTRNPARPGGGFRLNGPLANHYPDFIAHTARGNTLLIETKGDVYNNTDSAYKRRLGAAWATAAGRHYRYYMVFDKATVAGAQRLATFPSLLAEL